MATRQTGILRRWDAERGFGFIAPTQGGHELFVHVSQLPRDGTLPVEGETLSYELGRGRNGRPQAMNVHRQALGSPATQPPRRKPLGRRTGSAVGTIASIALTLCLAAGCITG